MSYTLSWCSALSYQQSIKKCNLLFKILWVTLVRIHFYPCRTPWTALLRVKASVSNTEASNDKVKCQLIGTDFERRLPQQGHYVIDCAFAKEKEKLYTHYDKGDSRVTQSKELLQPKLELIRVSKACSWTRPTLNPANALRLLRGRQYGD